MRKTPAPSLLRCASQRSLHLIEDFARAQVDDFIEQSALNLTDEHAVLIFHADHFSRRGIGINRAAFLTLQPLGTGVRDLEAHRDVVRDVVAAQRNATGRREHALHVEHVVRGAAAEVDEQGAVLLGFLVEHHLRGCERKKHNVFHFQGDLTHQTYRVLHAAANAVDNVKFRFKPLSLTANQRTHLLLSIHAILARDAMQEDVVLRDIHRACRLTNVFKVVLGDGILIGRQAIHARVVQALDVRAAHAEEDIADHHVAAVLGAQQGIIEAGLREAEILDLTLADAARGSLADSENLDGAVLLHLSDDHTDL